MPVPIFTVDAFASAPFTGNPAGVCLLTEVKPEEWMRNVAAEMKHAETAFVSPRENGFDLRWFTPTDEVDLCGHATLSAAHILWETEALPATSAAVFHTKSGELRCTKHGYGIQMDFPAEPATRNVERGEAVLAALGVPSKHLFLAANRMDVMVVLQDEQQVRSLAPNFAALAEFACRGFIVTAPSEQPEYDFISRFFGPAVGVPEDPVTGSAHCCLGPYWSARFGKADVVGYQASERGGVVRVAVRGDRVLLQGVAITTLRGEFLA